MFLTPNLSIVIFLFTNASLHIFFGGSAVRDVVLAIFFYRVTLLTFKQLDCYLNFIPLFEKNVLFKRRKMNE